MRPILTFAASALFLTGLAFADEWTGQLVDATCTNNGGGAHGCDPGVNTVKFGLVINGDSYLLDSKGNSKAAAAIKFRAESAAADHPPAFRVNASINGTKAGKTILVQSIVLDQ